MSSFSIYMIANDINDKVYIGQTTRKIQERFEEHCTCGLSPISRFIQSIGKEHFSISILDDTATNLDELLEKERYYVKKYNSIEEGYNTAYPSKTHGRIHHTTLVRNAVDKELYARLKEYSEKTSIPLSKLLDKAIAMFLETVEK